MGFDGGHRAAARQISDMVDAIFIGPSTGSTAAVAGDWCKIRVISSKAVFASITAPGLVGSSKFTSGTSWAHGTEITCSQITAIKISSNTTNHAVIAYTRVLL